ncbi:MAG: HlyD family efflux transporter periplasmic adaptor subunit [Thermoflavifilum sp.]|nr:HlyD family efflux transporter periplasmic adaptor subunit [Thermoflavifilum sp.]MCL6512955.1 HlyD family efflux transporter periplasmic adaptor subunit [Alicyclobacillus sp.]
MEPMNTEPMNTEPVQATPALRRRRRWVKPVAIAAVVVVIGGAAAYAVLARQTNHASTAQLQIRWVTVQRGTVAQTVSFSGTLQPKQEVTLTANGTVTSVDVKVGDNVKAGQTIAQLDTSSLETQLEAAKAQLAQAQAKLAQAEEPVTVQSGSGRSSTQAPDPNVVAQAQAGVEQAQAQVDQIEQEIAACTVTSPISGTVLDVVQPYSTASSSSETTSSGSSTRSSVSSGSGGGSEIAIIANLNPDDFEVQASVAQADVTSLKTGQSCVISLSTGGPTLTGKIESVGYLPQTQSGVTTYPVVVDVNPPSDSSVKLLPGASVSVTATVAEADNVLTLPVAAITQFGGQTGVFVSSSGTGSGNGTGSSSGSDAYGGSSSAYAARFRRMNIPAGLRFQPVTVGVYGNNTVEIKSGLTEGEQVAVVTQTVSSTTSTSGSTTRQGFGAFGGVGGFGGAGFGGAFGGTGTGGYRGTGTGGYSGSRGGGQ